jgi:hypothetical protein
MVNIRAPLLVHGSPVVAANLETHILSREFGLALYEDVRWFQHSQSSTSPFTFDVPTGMDGDWTITFNIYMTSINLLDIRCGTWTRVAGVLQADSQFNISNASGLGYPLSVSGDNARITITPPNANSIKWTVKAHILRV